MALILDNPIWNAAQTGNKSICSGNENIAIFDREIAWFAGMLEYSNEALVDLGNYFQKGENVILFTENKLSVPSVWNVELERPLAQFVYNTKIPFEFDTSDLKPLTYQYVDQMLDLTALTKPGPFFNKTMEFGDYYGIFDQERLVSMTGSRLHVGDFVEVSAVCTHPDYVGRGMAGALIKNQVNILLSRGKIPYLHAFPDNPAVNLYLKLGFVLRKELIVYRLTKSV